MVFEENINCVLAVESGYAVFFFFGWLKKISGTFCTGYFGAPVYYIITMSTKKDEEEDLAPDDVKKCHLIERRVNSK